MFTKRLLLVCVLVGVICGVSVAGSKIDGWVVDDFESYSSTAEMKATSLTTGGPWGILQEIQYSLGLIEWPAGALLEINLMPSPPHGTGDPNDTNDPNGFTAVNEIDADGPQSMEVHYLLTEAGSSCDVIIMAHNLGVPFAMMAVGPPLGDVPVADLTTIDKLTMKIKKNSGNTTVEDTFEIGLIGPDMGLIGAFPATSKSSGNKFLEHPENVWETLEFDINGPMDTTNATSVSNRSAVSAIIIGTWDTVGSEVRYLLDDIMLFNEGNDCHAWSSADINMDCAVNMDDLAALASAWLGL
jgi:hypothetical protein